ncbi:hypothetical protein [Stutzerimonas tarimensis]|uniref:HdeD family acid-resistance protein n=1 Tax=Stutzerimonas tarimensis TaxID=1507735 RepID=A0ABV7T856_9GAMM
MQPENPYTTPRAKLVDESGAVHRAAGWSPGRLRMLALLCLAAMIGTLALLSLGLVASATADLVLQRAAFWLRLVLVLLETFLLIRFKEFVERCFAARGVGWPVWLVILFGLVGEALELLMADRLVLSSGWQLGFLLLLAAQGLCLAWLGLRLLALRKGYPSLRALAWLNIVGGLMLASLILLLPALLPLLGAQLAMALVFFRAAREAGHQSSA